MEIAALTQRLRRLNWPSLLLCASLAGFTLYVLATAWVAEDAYITFRVIDNFWHGYGLRWNVHERVQVYTHPLWMLLQLVVNGFVPNPFLVAMALGTLCTFLALAVTVHTAQRTVTVTLLFLLLPLLLSNSVMDYTTSGLENSLSFLLLAAFGYVALRLKAHRYFWFYGSLAVALALVNRLDTAIFYAPPAGYFLYTMRGHIRWRQIALGMTPLIAWLLFSLFYYGFIFPNTKYAKLDAGMPLSFYLGQGFYYAYHLLIRDMAGAVILLSLPCFFLRATWFSNARFAQSMALGIAGYCLYVIMIGGDYMAGRAWAFSIFACVWLWHVSSITIRRDIAFSGLCALIAAAVASTTLLDLRKFCADCILRHDKVIDAKATCIKNHLVFTWHPIMLRTEGEHLFLAKQGKSLAEKESDMVRKAHFIGMNGYYAGPQVTLVDELAIADPLLARLPAVKEEGLYVGHLRRELPDGYIRALRRESLRPLPPSLAKYYEKLRVITAGDLLNKERLKTIILFNLGDYDHWKQEYLDGGA